MMMNLTLAIRQYVPNLLYALLLVGSPAFGDEPTASPPFGPEFPKLDSDASGQWWNNKQKNGPPRLMVERDQVIGFALCTHDHGVLKLTAQMYPLMPEESREVRLELNRNDKWEQVLVAPIVELGWSAHFRIENWDNTINVPYRLRHGDKATFEGMIRQDPIDKETIVVASMSCNSSRTPGPRPQVIENLKLQDPDLLFFAGDQSYHHTEHTFGWLEFGMQFRDVMRDRPTVTIPDDHDVGQPNLWGEGGKLSVSKDGSDGGYNFPVEYVNMVQRCQTWHLPDPVDPVPLERGIGVYFTNLVVGGIDFAIIEDRKFKSGPEGKIPQMGPRPDHFNDPNYKREAIDLEGLELLGDRQEKFLASWAEDWTGAQMKCLLSQTAFCGAVHLHGKPDNRLLADLDCNGWPQTKRNDALRLARRAWATHICGDQHLAVVVKHGIDTPSDGPYSFTSPAIVNTIYGRWWHPLDEKAGLQPVENSPLPWTGEFQDGLGNFIRMIAYANPPDVKDEKQRGDGYGIVRFHKKDQSVTFECWPRFSDVREGDEAQYPGWPVTFNVKDNDGRAIVGYLAELSTSDGESAVVQVSEDSSGEVLYTVRTIGPSFKPPVYAPGNYTIKAGKDKADLKIIKNLTPVHDGETARIQLW